MNIEKTPPAQSKHSIVRIAVIVLFCILVGIGLLMIVVPPLARVRVTEPPAESFCGIHFLELSKAILTYAEDHNGMCPTPSQWCDLLVNDANVPLEYFRCPVADTPRGQCSYALNKYLVGADLRRLPLDQVLLFESKSGWNQVGGPELLNMGNHEDNRCYVSFVGLHAEFIRAASLFRLKWEDEAK